MVRKKFTVYERDTETNLDYAQARMFQSGFGRFTSPDPLQASASTIRPQSWNRYSYSYNNTLRFTDPSGMIAGDFYNQDGNKIGTDGKGDGKAYLVTDDNEAKKIAKTKGDYTAVVNSALELPSYEIRQEIGVAAVNRSNSPTADDKTGGFHEEGGVVLDTSDGVVAVPAPSGAASKPNSIENVTVDVYGGVSKETYEKTTGLVTTYHIHPSGTIDVSPQNNASTVGKTVIGGSERQETKYFAQPPSQADKNGIGTLPTKLGYHIVVGAGSKTILGQNTGGQKVYFYNSSGGVKGSLPLNKFVGIR